MLDIPIDIFKSFEDPVNPVILYKKEKILNEKRDDENKGQKAIYNFCISSKRLLNMRLRKTY